MSLRTQSGLCPVIFVIKLRSNVIAMTIFQIVFYTTSAGPSSAGLSDPETEPIPRKVYMYPSLNS